MKKCLKTISGKHLFMSVTIKDMNGWIVNIGKKCIHCGLVDDKTVKVTDLTVKWQPK